MLSSIAAQCLPLWHTPNLAIARAVVVGKHACRNTLMSITQSHQHENLQVSYTQEESVLLTLHSPVPPAAAVTSTTSPGCTFAVPSNAAAAVVADSTKATAAGSSLGHPGTHDSLKTSRPSNHIPSALLTARETLSSCCS